MIPAADSAVQVVTDLGDATGSARCSGLDAAHIACVARSRDGGFAAYPLKDPILIGDRSGNGWLSARDAAMPGPDSLGDQVFADTAEGGLWQCVAV